MNSLSSTAKSVFRLALRANGVAGLWLAAQFACAAPPKISPDLNLQHADQDVEVIVQYKVTPDENHHQRVARLGGRCRPGWTT